MFDYIFDSVNYYYSYYVNGIEILDFRNFNIYIIDDYFKEELASYVNKRFIRLHTKYI